MIITIRLQQYHKQPSACRGVVVFITMCLRLLSISCILEQGFQPVFFEPSLYNGRETWTTHKCVMKEDIARVTRCTI